MKLLSRVVWSEGMYLAPHHLQTQSRYFEDTLAFLAAGLWRDPWGMLQLAMNQQAIANGTVSLLHASGIFQDGLCFDMPGSDALPPARSVASLAESTEAEVVLHLAIPARRGDGYDLSVAASPAGEAACEPGLTRYRAATRVLRDETNGMDEQEVGLAHKNIRIVAARELEKGMLSLPIARIVRDANNGFQFDPEFVPCSLRVSAGDTLMLQIKRLLEVLTEKSLTIQRPVQSPGRLRIGNLPMEIANYWFLHALHSAIPALQHLAQTRHAHPSECFLELSRLAGALCTFALESDAGALPAYDHADPAPGFRTLLAHIYRHLEIIIPTNCIELAFEPFGPYLHRSPVADERCLRRSRWILGVRTSLGESEQLRLVPRLIKVCSERFVQELVKRALPGMSLTHLPVPPAALRAAADMQYYAIDIAGPCWQHILQTRSVGIYIPGEIADAEFTLSVILEQAP